MKTNIKLTKSDIPSHATHPGQLIADEIEFRGVKQKELANLMGIAENILSEIIHAKRNITPTLAIKLENILEVKYSVDKIKIEKKEEILKMKITKKQRNVFASKIFQRA
jgi:addiction module HigA family antidote